MIAVDLSKNQVLHVDPRANQQINFTANLDRTGNTRIYFILDEANETILDFTQGTVKVLYVDIIFLDSTKLKIVWKKITFFKQCVSIML